MNTAKFASITSDLVVRKGEARPWPQRDSPQRDLPPRELPPRAPLPMAARDDEDPLEADYSPPEPRTTPTQDNNTRRCALKLSPCEYERLGIIAVKRNTSRQQILRMAVEEYLAAIEQEYGRECGCLGGRGCSAEKPPVVFGQRTF